MTPSPPWADALPPPGGRIALPADGIPLGDADADQPAPHLREYLFILYKHRWLALTAFGTVLALALLVTILTPRRYTAATRIRVARQAPIQLRLQDNVRRIDEPDRPTADGSVFVATEVAALQSRDLAERVIRSRGLLENDSFLHPRSRSTAVLSLAGVVDTVRPRGWQADAVATPAEPAPAPPAAVDAKLLDRYMKWISVADVRGTDLIEVRFTTPNPTMSAFLAAAHTQAYLEANDDARRATDVVANQFLAEQQARARKRLERAEAALDRFAAEHPNVAVNQEEKVAATKIGDLSAILTRAETTRTTLESRYEFLKHPDTDPLAYFLDRPEIQRLRLTLLDARAQRAALQQRLGPNHPRMLELGRLEGELDQQLRSEVQHAVASVRTQYEAARSRETQLRTKLDQLEQTGIELRSLGSRYELLHNDVETARGLHDSLMRQRNETAVNSELGASNVRVVERAEVPIWPSRPNVLLDLTLGVLFGLIAGVGAPFAREYFEAGVKSSEDVERLLRLPTLATIPAFERRPALAGNGHLRNGHGREADLVVAYDPWSRVAEAFRHMRTALVFSDATAAAKLIVITSAGPGEGKTVASLNLATALAEAGARVLLVDADLRHPRCHSCVGIPNDRGLANHLADPDGLDIDALVHALESPPIHVLLAGGQPANPAELVTSPRLRRTFDRLRTSYDYVIVDTPPVLPVTDAVVIAREADGVVLVVKGHETPRELVRRARDRLALAGARVLGVMVNNVGLGWDETYFYDPYAAYTRLGDSPGRISGVAH